MAYQLLLVLSMFVPITHGAPGPQKRDTQREWTRNPALQSPVRLADAGGNALYVTDARRRQLLRVDKGLRRIREMVDISGQPLAVACFEGQVLIGNGTTGRVEVYRHRGGRLYRHGISEVTFTQPTDIAIDDSAALAFVVDTDQKVVKVLNLRTARLSLARTIPANGPDPAQLAHPTGIAVDPSRGEVLVADYGQPDQMVPARIQVFDYAGNHVATLSGQQGMFGARFSRPQGLALDGKGRVFLVESLLGQVLVLDRKTGATLGSFGTYGFERGQLAMPLDVVFDAARRRLYVTNNLARSIRFFRTEREMP